MNGTGILIVEDEVLIAMGIQQKLENFGYQVVGIASSGEAALAQVIEHQPELILMDIVIDGSMDGIEAAQKIQEQFGIPVIFLTAYSDEKNLRRAKFTDPSAYLLKPYSERELEITIELALHRVQMGVSLGKELSLCCQFESAKGPVDLQKCLPKVFVKGSRVQMADLRLLDDPAKSVVDLSIVPIKAEDGGIKGGAMVLHDKTETKRLLKKLDQHLEPDSRDLLTYREKQVLNYMVQGQATKQLAETLGISPRTVEFHRYNLMRKLQVEDVPSLVRRALSQGLIEPE